ncbi:MAG: hypothetical protein ACI8Y4_004754 [Candidatus Poriferisodalaceae bacterium]|jgi:hypothetical protein
MPSESWQPSSAHLACPISHDWRGQATRKGDHAALADELGDHPDAVNAACGPKGWPPLLHAVYSRISTGNPDWSTVETVKVLLDRGADPNDGQLLYNNGIGGQNHDDPAHLPLLVGYGLGTQQDGPWYRRLGDQLRDPAELRCDTPEPTKPMSYGKHSRSTPNFSRGSAANIAGSARTSLRNMTPCSTSSSATAPTPTSLTPTSAPRHGDGPTTRATPRPPATSTL